MQSARVAEQLHQDLYTQAAQEKIYLQTRSGILPPDNTKEYCKDRDLAQEKINSVRMALWC